MQSVSTSERLLKVNDACALLAVSRATLYRLINARVVPVVRVGGMIRFRYQSLLHWMEEHETTPAKAA